MQAFILAAGLGTRLHPLTDHCPKALVEVNGMPLLHIAIDNLVQQGINHIVINVHHFAEMVCEYLSHNAWNAEICISDEREMLLDTGGALKKAEPLFKANESILIHNVDILSNVRLGRLYDLADSVAAADAAIDALLLVSDRKTKRYLQFDDEMRLTGWKNIETGEVKGLEGRSLAFSGIHVIGPGTFPLFEEMPDRFGIIDFYLKYCERCIFLGYDKKDLRLLDVGKLDTLEQAEKFIQ